MVQTNTLANEDVGYIDGIIRDFNNKLSEFERLRQWFVAEKDIAKTDAVLNQEYNDLMKRAELLDGTIQKAKDAINQLNNMVANMTPDWLKDWFNNNNDDSLGFVPLLVAGAITGALAWLGTWITDAYIVGKKIEAQKALLAAGGDPDVIARTVWGQDTGGTMFGLGSIGTLGLLLLAGGAVFLYQKYYG